MTQTALRLTVLVYHAPLLLSRLGSLAINSGFIYQGSLAALALAAALGCLGWSPAAAMTTTHDLCECGASVR